jgi:tetratricopeptide (TPR) repeat protein
MAFSGEIEKLERRWQENPLGLTFAPLAEAYRKAGDPARALELLEQGLAQHPNYVPAHIVRGRCHLDTQEDAVAEQAFLRVTGIDPENVIALKGLAELSERAGRLPEAIQRLEMLLDVDRNNEEARGQLDRVRELLSTRSAAGLDLAAPVSPGAALPETVPPVSEPVPPPAAPEPAASAPETTFAPEPSYAAPEPTYSAPEPSYTTSEPMYQESGYQESVPAVSEASEAPVSETAETFQDDPLMDIELEAASQLTSATAHEFQIDNDSESLSPSGDRIADIILGAEPPGDDQAGGNAGYEAASAPSDQSGENGVDRANALLGEGYERMAYQEVPSSPGDAEETGTTSGTTIFDQIAMMAEVPTPAADLLPPPSPAEPEGFAPPPSVESESFLPPAPEPEPVPSMEAYAAADPVASTDFAPVAEQSAPPMEGMAEGYVPIGDLGAPSAGEPAAPVHAEDSEPSATEEPELVVTETMAEIFLRQGHRELARAVYTQLALRDPDNERIAAALTRLAPEPSSAPAPEPVQRFAASETGGRSVAELLQSLLAATRPTPASAIHPPAFESPKRVTGEPTRPAQESLSLSAVFGEESSSPAPAGAPREASTGEPSFDEFFAPATGPAADTELPRDPDSGAMSAQVPEDLEQFNAWLRGLKR